MFSNSGLETLALDPGLVRTWKHVGRAVSHSPLALLQAYCHTKHRCHVALTDCRNRTYGIREEYRATGALLVALDECMQSLGIASQALTVPNESPALSSPRSFPCRGLESIINKGSQYYSNCLQEVVLDL
ncbi:uncharacterized protein BDW43DRAFT_307184 [Aspergillus alliaceus]|uniref:uncharacterized protein n=1 Tax=Petromyces alliaceus TaxID=209559 RepID=UPI0012A6AAF6|nr:uncharacterized protein BDW43DRAFT_307184 [Aspergillus alliaceus]KAB8237667.1 hypothetical protein BDW43DRAFT_307184 [Aspergillus alliaceus]